MSITFSIIIPAHNEENYIRKTLHSIKKQTYQNYETIVVANGCTDSTEEIIKKRTNDKLKLLTLNKPNVSRARNYGAGKAEGEILLFLDADTTLEEDALKKIKEQFVSKAVATTRVKADSKKSGHQLLMALKNLHNKTGLYKGCSGVLICHRENFDKVNGYDPSIIVKEHRKLTLKLQQLGDYSCLNTYVTTSMRRFQKWGVGKVTSFWIQQWVKDKVSSLKDSDYEKVR